MVTTFISVVLGSLVRGRSYLVLRWHDERGLHQQNKKTEASTNELLTAGFRWHFIALVKVPGQAYCVKLTEYNLRYVYMD